MVELLRFSYPDEVKSELNTSFSIEYQRMAHLINHDSLIQIVLIQHEFGLFKEQEQSFLEFLSKLTKPVILVFHTVLPHPDDNRPNQTVYSLCTGGCYDGLEEAYINLSQGAEATVSYLMARLTMEKYKHQDSLSVEMVSTFKTINTRIKRAINS